MHRLRSPHTMALRTDDVDRRLPGVEQPASTRPSAAPP
jgi:hypothetical protein